MVFILNILIAVCIVGALVVPYTGDVMPEGDGKKKPTWRFYVITFLAIATFSLGLWKDEVTEQQQQVEIQVRDSQQERKDIFRDSVARAQSDASVASAVTAISKGIGEDNLKVEKGFDGVTRIVRDSAKRVINRIQEREFYFGVCVSDNPSEEFIYLTSVTSDSCEIAIEFCARTSTVTGIKFHIIYITRVNGEYRLHTVDRASFNHNFTLHAGHVYTTKATIAYPEYAEDVYYVYIFGEYNNIERSRRLPIDIVYKKSRSLKKDMLVAIDEERAIRNLVLMNLKGARDFWQRTKEQK